VNRKNRYYIGLSATIHDPAIAIVDPSGELIFAEASERYLQCKRAYNCTPDDMIRVPRLVAKYCAPDAELVGAITWSANQLSQLNLMTAAPFFDPHENEASDAAWPFPHSSSLLIALRNSISQAALNLSGSKQITNDVSVRYYDHHLTHAANTAYSSPFKECAIAVIDAYGEMSSTACFHYHDGKLEQIYSLDSNPNDEPGSLGFFYARLCSLCGFDPVKGEEWKVMGLAPYGKFDAELYELLRPSLRVDDLKIKAGCSKAEASRLLKELRARMRPHDASPLLSANLACTGQTVFEEVMTELLNNLYKRGLSENLGLSGGCALNSSYNGRILKATRFKQLHVPSAPADDGNAVGAAFLAHGEDNPDVAREPVGLTPFLGSSISSDALERMMKYSFLRGLSHHPDDICEKVARLLSEEKIVGWIQGPAEFGPRALGNRSILADPRPAGMKDRINSRIKFREEFRPFAPSILHEYGSEYFVDYQFSPYMERTLRFKPEACVKVPAVVHVDGTGRLQSVTRGWNPRYYDLISAFHRLTNVPLILNTSLNVMGKPIVHSLEDALGLFFTAGLDALVVEDYLIEK
jgi:carbamoyltransferase